MNASAHRVSFLAFFLFGASLGGAACGSDDSTAANNQGGANDAGQGTDGARANDSGITDSGHPGTDSGVVDSGSDGGSSLADPNLAGPFTYAEKDDTTTVTSTADSITIHAAYPTSGAGPFPLVVFAPGFEIDASQYVSYLQRLASFGYVALTVLYPQSFGGNNNTNEATDIIAGIDWAAADATFGSKVDTTKVGMSGHSLGGTLALLAATMDTRVKAAITLDPVDNGTGGGGAVQVIPLMSGLHIPTGFLGETTDSTSAELGQACAPAADNFAAYYAQTNSPSFAVTVLGADHFSFVDDPSCTLCMLCTAGTASDATVAALAHAYIVAFYERNLRGNTAYDTYLTGAQATARYVTTSEVTIVSK